MVDALTGSPAYHPLNAGSPAIDAGDNTVCANAPVSNTSQNGVTRPQDGDGNGTALCDIGSYELDNTAPDTQIDTQPANPTISTAAAFTFSSADITATFECSLDTAAFASCSSPQNLSGLAATVHTFTVRAVDSASNIDSTPASYTWTIQKQRLLNGSFEKYSKKTPKIPASWKAAKFALTDGKSTTKKTGKYALAITGAAVTKKTLSQQVILSGVAGETFTLSFWSKGSAVPKAGLCQAQVLFYVGKTLKGKSPAVKCPAKSAWKLATKTFTSPVAYNNIIVKFTYSKASGTIYIDLASLIK